MAEPTTVIGEFTSIQGNLQGDEDLQVFGRVEGGIQLERTLVVEPSGVVKADVAVRNAVVSGVVVGNIQASESVRIEADGRMVGDIVAPRVIIVEGAMFRGRVDMGESKPARTQAEAPAPERVDRPTTGFTRTQPAAAPSRAPVARAPRPEPAPAPRAPAAKPEPVRAAPAPAPRPLPKEEPPPPPPPPEDEEDEEEIEEVEDDRSGGQPPPPRPRIAQRKRRVSVKKK